MDSPVPRKRRTYNYECCLQGCTDKSRSIREMLKHMFGFHEKEPNPIIVCTIDKCREHFLSLQNYRRHVFIQHSDISESQHHDSVESIPINGADHGEHDDMCSEDMDNTNETYADPRETYEKLIQWVAEQCISLKLKIEYEHSCSYTTTKKILFDVQELIIGLRTRLSMCILEALQRNTVPNGDVFMILNDSFSFERAIRESGSDLQEAKLLSGLGFVAPVKCIPDGEDVNDENDEDLETRDGVLEKRAKDTYYYVPLLDSLRIYLSCDDVYQSIQERHISITDDRLSGLKSGSFIKNHPVFGEHPDALQIVVYTDEFGVTNPLGPHQSKHKQIGVYWSLHNVDRKYASTTQGIFLAILARYELLKRYSYTALLKPLIQDLKVLESEGINLVMNGKTLRLKGGLALVLGDNLSLHNLGGFNPRFSSGLVCRKCMIPYEQIKHVWSEDECEMRSAEHHSVHVQAVLTDPSLASTYGVYHEACLSGLNSYDPIDSLPFDDFHNLEFGLFESTLTAVIRGLVKRRGNQHVLSLDEINGYVSNFPYGQNDKTNKISKVSVKVIESVKSATFSGTGAEREHFFRMLSLIIGQYIPEDNDYWRLYLISCQISDILKAPVIMKSWLPELKHLIRDYLALWNSLPEDVVGSFKPKMHYLIHAPSQLLKYGPTCSLTTRKYERFHQIQKGIIRVANNKINVSQTCAIRFQRKKCYELSGGKGMPEANVLGPHRTVKISGLHVWERQAVQEFFGGKEQSFTKLKRAKVQGLLFKTDDYVVIEVEEPHIAFLHVLGIYKNSEKFCLYGRLAVTDEWNGHLHAFRLREDENDEESHVCVPPEKITSHQRLSAYVIENAVHIRLKWRIPQNSTV